MKKNVGSIDKIVRLILGIIIAALGIYYQSWWGLIALLPFGTALMGFCPAYFPFKIKTTKE